MGCDMPRRKDRQLTSNAQEFPERVPVIRWETGGYPAPRTGVAEEAAVTVGEPDHSAREGGPISGAGINFRGQTKIGDQAPEAAQPHDGQCVWWGHLNERDRGDELVIQLGIGEWRDEPDGQFGERRRCVEALKVTCQADVEVGEIEGGEGV